MHLAIGWIGTTPSGYLRLSESNIRHAASYVASEAVHVILLPAAVRRVYPEPCTDTPALGAWWHGRRHLEIGEACPDARLVDTEHSEVFRLYLRDITLVGDCQGAAEEIVDAFRVPLTHVRAGTWIVGVVRVTDVSAL